MEFSAGERESKTIRKTKEDSQDAVEVAQSRSIRNARNFAYNESGTMESMRKDNAMRMNFFTRFNDFKRSGDGSGLDNRIRYASMADEAFDEEGGKA